MMMTTPPVAAPDAATLLVPTAGSGFRCIHCGRVWPGHPQPYMHRFTFATKPFITCTCENDHRETVWQAFEIINRHGCVLAGMVCPRCVTTPGFEAVVAWALGQAMRAELNVN